MFIIIMEILDEKKVFKIENEQLGNYYFYIKIFQIIILLNFKNIFFISFDIKYKYLKVHIKYYLLYNANIFYKWSINAIINFFEECILKNYFLFNKARFEKLLKFNYYFK